VLAGAELAAAAQGTESSFSLDYRSPAFVRTAVLLIVFRTTERALSRDAPPCTIESLAAELEAPMASLRPILDQLENAGIIIVPGGDFNESHAGLFLARDSSELTLAEVFESFEHLPRDIHGDERISGILKSLAAVERESLGNLTLKDLVLGRFASPLAARVKVEQINPE
jgi:DNA-binding IscR family transcriptional regulator